MAGLWKKFNPANDLYDQPLAYRGTIAPFGTYTNPDGSESAGFAWPGMITEPLNALQRLHENSYTEDGRLGMPNPQYQGNKDDALTSLLSIYGGNALNPMKGGAARTVNRAATHDLPPFDMSEGRGSQTIRSAIAAENANAVKAWHSTPAKFDTFDNAYTDEVGFHFGSKNQAHNRAYVESGGNPWTYFTKWRDIPVEMDVKNPANISRDVGQFNGENVARQLVKDSIAPIDLLANVMNQPEAARNAAVRNWLVENGYDAVKYPNRFEGVGDPSYMMLNTGNVRHARTGDTLYSDTGKPSLMGSAVSSTIHDDSNSGAVNDPAWLEDFLRRYY